jgi:hypothetical protein
VMLSESLVAGASGITAVGTQPRFHSFEVSHATFDPDTE